MPRWPLTARVQLPALPLLPSRVLRQDLLKETGHLRPKTRYRAIVINLKPSPQALLFQRHLPTLAPLQFLGNPPAAFLQPRKPVLIIGGNIDNRVTLTVEATFKQERGIDDDGFDRWMILNRSYDSRAPLRNQGVHQPFQATFLRRISKHDLRDPPPIRPPVSSLYRRPPPRHQLPQHLRLGQYLMIQPVRCDHAAALTIKLACHLRLARPNTAA